MGFTNLDIAISVGVQQMVRSDKASSGVYYRSRYWFSKYDHNQRRLGLGENIVKGTITPDEWMVFKPTLENKTEPHSQRHCGRKIHDDLCRKSEKLPLNVPS
jgi:pyruvate,water dikinase